MNFQETIKRLTVELPEWCHQKNHLIGEWRLADFARVRAVVAGLCDLADELNHHPTVTYGYNTLRIETTTHDAGNIVTELDVELAQRVSQLIEE